MAEVGVTFSGPFPAFHVLVQPPEAQQDVAFVAFQFRVDTPPEAMVEGVAERVRVGAGLTVYGTVDQLFAEGTQSGL